MSGLLSLLAPLLSLLLGWGPPPRFHAALSQPSQDGPLLPLPLELLPDDDEPSVSSSLAAEHVVDRHGEPLPLSLPLPLPLRLPPSREVLPSPSLVAPLLLLLLPLLLLPAPSAHETLLFSHLRFDLPAQWPANHPKLALRDSPLLLRRRGAP
jgi:hypothetical protein